MSDSDIGSTDSGSWLERANAWCWDHWRSLAALGVLWLVVLWELLLITRPRWGHTLTVGVLLGGMGGGVVYALLADN